MWALIKMVQTLYMYDVTVMSRKKLAWGAGDVNMPSWEQQAEGQWRELAVMNSAEGWLDRSVLPRVHDALGGWLKEDEKFRNKN